MLWKKKQYRITVIYFFFSFALLGKYNGRLTYSVWITRAAKQFVLHNYTDAPEVQDMDDIQVKEGSDFAISCPYFAGNPHETTVTWTRESDGKTWETSYLHLEMVNYILDNTTFTCTAENSLHSTGTSPTIGSSQKSFRLTVICCEGSGNEGRSK